MIRLAHLPFAPMQLAPPSLRPMNLQLCNLWAARKAASAAPAGAWPMAVFFTFLLAAAGLAADSVAELLGPGDSIRVTVFQNPDLTTEARISSQGTVVVPLIGEVVVADQTPIQAGALIARQLREGGFVLDPQVSVNLIDQRSSLVSILGHVGKPGKYPLDGTQLRLSDVLAMAGGIRETGDDTVIVVTQRNGHEEKLEIDVPQMYESGDLSADIELTSGDAVFVPPAPVFYVYGAVQRPGAYRLEDGASVMNAITLGGGLTPRGSQRGLKIHRRADDGSIKVLDVDLTDPVQADDVIHVRERIF